MSVICLIEIPTKSEHVDDMKAYFKEILPDTRSFDGCESIVAYIDTEDTANIILHEVWISRKHHEKYIKWRLETGVMQKIVSMCSVDSLSPKYFDLVDA